MLLSAVAFSQDIPNVVPDTSHQSVLDSVFIPKTDTIKPKVLVDSLPKVATRVSNVDKVDSVLKHHSPRTAALRSALIPGWGQIYNKKYWKLPIVYGALGVAGGIFNYNLQWYKKTRFAYKALANKDTVGMKKVDPLLKPIVDRGEAQALRSYRDEFRKNIDYSALFFILMWGLNVVDATVDAHLKPFDVSPELSLKFKLGPSEMARTTGVSLVLAFK